MTFVRGQSGNPNGRKPGAKNRVTIEREMRMQALTANMRRTIEDSEVTAHDVLMAIYKHPDSPTDLKLEAAKAAIRFEMPALLATYASNDDGGHLSFAERLTNARRRMIAIDVQPVREAAE